MLDTGVHSFFSNHGHGTHGHGLLLTIGLMFIDYGINTYLIYCSFTHPQGSRITMKLDVSYTDHSHIIGRGGLTIKKVMEETGCHVHFPDSNRSVNAEKSNQVSVAGSLLGLERARYRIRVSPLEIEHCLY